MSGAGGARQRGSCACKASRTLANQAIGHDKAKFLVRFKGYGPRHDEWVDYANVTPELIKEFLVEHGLYDHAWKHRCPVCDKPANSEFGVQTHQRRKHNNCSKYLLWAANEQSFTGTVAIKKAKQTQKEELQKSRPVVHCEGAPLKNVFLFKYLGSIFAADGSQEPDIKRRIGIANTRAGQLRHIFNSKGVSLATKLRLYEAAVVSLFTYGCEAWALTPKTIRQLNGANSRLLARFTGKSAHEEARDPSHDMIKSIRARRLCWLGHILRMKDTRLVKVAALHQHYHNFAGSLFLDAPNMGIPELQKLVNKRKEW